MHVSVYLCDWTKTLCTFKVCALQIRWTQDTKLLILWLKYHYQAIFVSGSFFSFQGSVSNNCLCFSRSWPCMFPSLSNDCSLLQCLWRKQLSEGRHWSLTRSWSLVTDIYHKSRWKRKLTRVFFHHLCVGSRVRCVRLRESDYCFFQESKECVFRFCTSKG